MVTGDQIVRIHEALEGSGFQANIEIGTNYVNVGVFREQPITFHDREMIKTLIKLIFPDKDFVANLFFDPSMGAKKAPMYILKEGEWTESVGQPSDGVTKSHF